MKKIFPMALLTILIAFSACRRNPVPLLIPCHRVVRSSGGLGGYGGGLDMKRDLLAMEQSNCPPFDG